MNNDDAITPAQLREMANAMNSDLDTLKKLHWVADRLEELSAIKLPPRWSRFCPPDNSSGQTADGYWMKAEEVIEAVRVAGMT